MKNLIRATTILMTLSLVFISCEKDKPVTNPEEDQTGKYQIYIDGSILVEGTTIASGAIQDADGNWVNTVTIGDDAKSLSIVVSQFSRTIGSTVTMDTDGDPGVVFTSKTDLYSTSSGTLTRESDSKISFEGTCTEFMSQTQHTIKGYIESNAYKLVN